MHTTECDILEKMNFICNEQKMEAALPIVAWTTADCFDQVIQVTVPLDCDLNDVCGYQ